jgi:hypothetical protein
MSLAIFAFRFKYYSVWSLGMVGMNAIGITYNPKIDDKGQILEQKWDRI